MVNRQTIRRKILHLVLSGVLLFSLGAVVLLSQPISAMPGEEALSFDGADDYILLPNDAFSSLSNGTIELWLKPSKIGDILSVAKDGSNNVAMYVYGGEKVRIRARLGGIEQFYAETPDNSLPYGAWHYLAWTKTGSTHAIYIDGNPSALTWIDEIDKSFYFDDVPATQVNKIGSAFYIAYFGGLIDEVRISNIARTPAEITANWNGGAGKRLENDANTVALWHMDEGTGCIIHDATANNCDGTLMPDCPTNCPAWVAGFPFPAVGAISQIVFTTPERTVTINKPSEAMTIQTQDESGNPTPVPVDTTINLGCSFVGGKFSLLPDPWIDISSVIISEGNSEATFYFKSEGDYIGDATISAHGPPAAEWDPAIQDVHIQGPVELWHLGSLDSTYLHIQQAIDAAEVDDTIIVHGGRTYNEHLFIDKRLTLKSTDGVVIINGQSLASGPWWRPESDIIVYPVVWIDAHNVVFGVEDGSYGGFYVKHAAPWGGGGGAYEVGIAMLLRAYDCVIENNIIVNEAGTNPFGLLVAGEDNQILSNQFSHNDMAVWVDEGEGNIIGTAGKGNIFHNNGFGVIVSNSSGSTVEDNTFYSNDAGIWLMSSRCHDIEITDNTIEDCTGGSIQWPAEEGEGMMDMGIEATAILMEHGTYNNTVSGNTIADGVDGDIYAADYGIHLRSAGYNGAGNTIGAFNTISDCREAGIYLEDCWEEDSVGMNILHNCKVGIRVTKGRNNTIAPNDISGGPLALEGIMVEDSDNNTIGGNVIWEQQDNGIYLRRTFHSSVEGNETYENRNGIYIEECNDSRVEGNETYGLPPHGNTEAGICLCNSDNIAIVSNEIWYNGEEGILIDGGSWENVISNNTIWYNGHGVWIEGGKNRVLGNDIKENTAEDSGVHIAGGAHDNEVRWNNFINNNTGLFSEERVYARDNWWGDATGPSGSGPGSGAGDAVWGDVDFDPWATSAFDIPEPEEVKPSLSDEVALPSMVSMWDFEEGGTAPCTTGHDRTDLLVKVDEPQSGLEEVTVDLRAVLEAMLPDIQARAAAELEEHELDKWDQWMEELERTQMWHEHYSYWDEAAGEEVWEEAWRYHWAPKWLFDQLRGFFDDKAVRDMFSEEALLGDFYIMIRANDWAGHSATSCPVTLTVVDMMRPLAAGWNLVSTPITLGEPEWGDVTLLGDGLEYSSILRYKGGKWQSYGTVGEDTGWCEDGIYMEPANFRPLEATYIKADGNDQLGLIWERNSTPTAPPSLDLETGWNLIAPACRGLGMAADEVLDAEEAARLVVVSPGEEFDYHQEFCDANYGGGEWCFGGQHWWFRQSAWEYTAGYGGNPIMTVIGGYWLSTDSARPLLGHTTTPIRIPLSPEPVREPPDLPRYQQVLMTEESVAYQLDGGLQFYITYQGDVSPSKAYEMYLREMIEEPDKPYNWKFNDYDSTLGEDVAHLNFQRKQGAAEFNAVIDITRGEGIHIDYELTEAGKDLADVPRYEWGPELVMTHYDDTTYIGETNIQYRVWNLDDEIDPHNVGDFYRDRMWEYGWKFEDETWMRDDGYEIVMLAFSKEGRHCSITAERWDWGKGTGVRGGLIKIYYTQH